MRIVTYNLYKGGSSDYGAWARIIDNLDPDILLLQESSAPRLYASHLAEPLCSQIEAHTVWSQAGRNYWGSAIYMRQGTLREIDISPEFTGWVVGAEVSNVSWRRSADKPLRIYSIHVPSGRGAYVAEAQAILNYIVAQRNGADIICGGDFNFTVGIRHSGEAMTTQPSERILLDHMREELHLMNCWQTSNPGQPLAQTLRWRFSSESQPYHYDGIFVPATWAVDLLHCQVLADENWQGKSDHFPVSAIFREPVGGLA